MFSPKIRLIIIVGATIYGLFRIWEGSQDGWEGSQDGYFLLIAAAVLSIGHLRERHLHKDK